MEKAEAIVIIAFKSHCWKLKQLIFLVLIFFFLALNPTAGSSNENKMSDLNKVIICL